MKDGPCEACVDGRCQDCIGPECWCFRQTCDAAAADAPLWMMNLDNWEAEDFSVQHRSSLERVALQLLEGETRASKATIRGNGVEGGPIEVLVPTLVGSTIVNFVYTLKLDFRYAEGD